MPDNRKDQKDTIHIAFASNDHYARPLAVTLSSISRSLSKNYRVEAHIINGGISLTNQNRIVGSVDPAHVLIIWVAPPSRKKIEFRRQGHMTKETLYRLFLPDLLPDLTKVLWLDCDLLVNQSIHKLWETGMGKFSKVAV